MPTLMATRRKPARRLLQTADDSTITARSVEAGTHRPASARLSSRVWQCRWGASGEGIAPDIGCLRAVPDVAHPAALSWSTNRANARLDGGCRHCGRSCRLHLPVRPSKAGRAALFKRPPVKHRTRRLRARHYFNMAVLAKDLRPEFNDFQRQSLVRRFAALAPLLLAVVVSSIPVAVGQSFGDACTRQTFDQCEQEFQENVLSLFGHEESRRQEAWCEVLQGHESCLELVLQSCRDYGYKELSARIAHALSDVVRKGCALPDSWSAADKAGSESLQYSIFDDESDMPATIDESDDEVQEGIAELRESAAALDIDGRYGSEHWIMTDRSMELTHSRASVPNDDESQQSPHRRVASNAERHAIPESTSEGSTATKPGYDGGADGSLSELLHQLRGLTRDMKHLYRRLPQRPIRRGGNANDGPGVESIGGW